MSALGAAAAGVWKPWQRSSGAETGGVPFATFEQRRQAYLDFAWAEAQQNRARPRAVAPFISANALMAAGHQEAALALVPVGLDMLANPKDKHNHGGNCGFQAWPGIDFYLRHGSVLSAEMKARFQQVYGHMGWYRFTNTSNHQLMGAVTRYLSSEAFPESAFGPPGPEWPADLQEGWRFRKDDPTGRKTLLRRIEQLPMTGPGEYASRPYGTQNILPILTVAELARDPELRAKAALAAEVALLQLAPCWLRGHLATFATRSYPDMLSQAPWGVAELIWLYAGGEPPGEPVGRGHNYAMQAAAMQYRPLPQMQAAATERDKPFRHRALMNGWRLDHYTNRSYAVFTRWAHGKMWIGQQYPCGVMWNEPDAARHSFAWVTCPHYDSATVRGKNAASNDHTHGCTPYEQMLQNGRSVLYVYQIPDEHPCHYALGFLPGGALAVANDAASTGRIYVHYRSVLLAISAPESFTWDPAGGIRMACSPPAAGDSEYRVMGQRFGVALETAHPDEVAGATPAERLEAFRKEIGEKTRIAVVPGPQVRVTYRDRAGSEMECVFDGENRVDGKLVDYAAWPVLENPWQEQPAAGDLVLKGTGGTRRYDFARWVVS